MHRNGQFTGQNTFHAEIESEPMNLDDFVISSTGSFAGDSPSPSLEQHFQNHAVASAIPIKTREQDGSPAGIIMPASLPHAPHGSRRDAEFSYVPRRVRKTSVDERNVSFFFFFVEGYVRRDVSARY